MTCPGGNVKNSVRLRSQQGYGACVPLVIRLHADPRRVRAEISSRGISLEEEAAVAVVYRRPRRRELPCAVLAVGRDALGMSGGVRFTERSLAVTEEDRRARYRRFRCE